MLKSLSGGKYTGIIVSIALFIVLDAAVLLLNFTMANQFARDTVVVNLAARQRTLSQQTVKSLLQTDNALGSGNVIDQPLADLKSSMTQFDKTLEAFLNGGEVNAADGATIYLDALDDESVRANLELASEVWAPFKAALQPIASFDGRIERDADFFVGAEEAMLEGDLYQAIIFAYENQTSAKLLEHLNNVAVDLEKLTAARAKRLRAIQISGIVLALATFLVIVFHFLRKLNNSDELLALAEKEKDDILDTVSEGLFLLDRDLNFGSQYSSAVEKIFRRSDLAGANFLELLRKIVPESTLNTARDYINLFFGDRVHEKLVDDLNPLDVVEVHFKEKNGKFITRFLGFDFKRVLVGEGVSHLLVTVNDITEVVALKRMLAQSRDTSKAQLDMLLDILHIEPHVLRDFLDDADDTADGINNVLKRPGQDAKAYGEKLADIFRRTHRLKGEASALGLASVANLADQLEDKVSELQARPELKGTDFLPLAMKLDELVGHMTSIRRLVDKLVKFRGAGESSSREDQRERRIAPRTDSHALFDNLAQRLADEQGKKVELVCHGFNFTDIPERFRRAVKDMTIQFIRNGVTHGIESPEDRLAAQKAQAGRIFVSFHKQDDRFELVYRDDGRGLPTEAIRRAAVDKGFVTADQIERMEKQQVLALIFRRGFSTASEVNGSAGRGIGMDVIRHLVQELNGRVKLATTPGKFTSFTVSLPAAATSATRAA